MLTEKEKEKLNRGLDQLDVDLDSKKKEKIAIYLSELMKWNKVYNLTGFRTFDENLVRNILDCLSVAAFVKGERMLDLGTGAGLPGFLLAIADNDQRWTLLDANGKKIRFLQQLKSLINQENVVLVNSRVQDYKSEQPYDGISTRAFDKISETLSLSQHLLKHESHFYALKGKLPEQELGVLPEWVDRYQIHEIRVPMLDEQRHLVDCFCSPG